MKNFTSKTIKILKELTPLRQQWHDSRKMNYSPIIWYFNNWPAAPVHKIKIGMNVRVDFLFFNWCVLRVVKLIPKTNITESKFFVISWILRKLYAAAKSISSNFRKCFICLWVMKAYWKHFSITAVPNEKGLMNVRENKWSRCDTPFVYNIHFISFLLFNAQLLEAHSYSFSYKMYICFFPFIMVGFF